MRRKGSLARPLVLLLGCAACQDAAPPLITTFEVAPAEVALGEAASFSWLTAGATGCTLTLGDDQPVRLSGCAAGSYRHTYAEAGRYLATFAVTTAGGQRATRDLSVTVTAAAATAQFSARADGLSVSFDASASVTPPGSRFSWAFGDGGKGEGVNVTHRYARSGDYTVTLSLLTKGTTTRTTKTVSVADGADDGPERIVLFDGGGLSAWRLERGGAATWRLADDYMEVTTGGRVGRNDLRTREVFTDFRLHVEFWVPASPAGTAEQSRGNSGVYLGGRYEVQVLDSYGRTLSGQNDAGAVYEVSDATVNASRPVEAWQSYEITFRAARFRDGTKVSPARVSVVWNGELIQDDVVILSPTRLGNAETGGDGALSGPVVLQDHGDRVRYRKVWLEPL